MITFKHRQFASEGELRLYMLGYNAYPEWPQIGVNGSRQDAPRGSLPATGWYDRDREQEAKDEARRERAEREFSEEPDDE